MSETTHLPSEPFVKLDYSLTGENAKLAVEKGLAEADWYQCQVPRGTMRGLLERKDGPPIRDTILWFSLIIISAYFTWLYWGTWWAIIPYIFYSALFASTSDARWHECGHGTAFKTDWMNDALYEVASFMIMRESTPWRWSHNRHHSDTIIVGRDPEIPTPQPPDPKEIALLFLNFRNYPKYFKHILVHASGRMYADEKTYIPESEFPKVYLRARIYVAIYASVIALAIYYRSLLPLFYIGFSLFFGTWLGICFSFTNHAGLAENVLDHRLNSRTFYTNPINRFLYWNMNYHVEHHMFPLVPYHALPKLHEAVKDDCPTPYSSLVDAWREIIPTVFRQVRDPGYYVRRKLPKRKTLVDDRTHVSYAKSDAEGWLEVCDAQVLGKADVIRIDHNKKTYAVYRDEEGKLYATDGTCTHGNAHLSNGLVKGKIIECAKHNGRFNLIDGSPARTPICRGLVTYPVEETNGRLRINVVRASGAGARAQKTYQFRVVSNRSVATFIKELVLEPANPNEKIAFTPGDYLQLDIPAYDTIRFADFDVPEPFATVWRNHHVFDFVAHNPEAGRRNNYSLASNHRMENTLRFNVRIATPPIGQDCAPGVGSSYVFNLRPGDLVSGIGPFGDFHIKPTQREMIYIGGGAGMAPLRAHLSHLLESENTARKISFWYGARSKQEIYYDDYFERLAAKHHNFNFHVALSAPLAEEKWEGHTGFIHEVVLEKYLREHGNPRNAEYYLCGPPLMIKACNKMLADLGVPVGQIAYDEF
jgi:MocE subfamily Rieske [2Fe-2S] domain protein